MPNHRPLQAVLSAYKHGKSKPNLSLNFGFLDPDHSSVTTTVDVDLSYEDARRWCFYLMRHHDPEGCMFFDLNRDSKGSDAPTVTVPVGVVA